MIDTKKKDINNLVEQIDKKLTNEIEIIQEIDKFLTSNNLIVSDTVNIEEMKMIYSENQNNSAWMQSNYSTVHTNAANYYAFKKYKTTPEGNELMWLFLQYIWDEYVFDKQSVEVLRLRLYNIFYKRAMFSFISTNKHLLKMDTKTHQRIIEQNNKFDETNKAIIWGIIGVIAFFVIVGFIAIMVGISHT